MRTISLLLLTAVYPFVNALGKTELCIVSKCFFPMATCVLDRDCRRFIQCANECPPDDEPCSSGCFFKYGNEKVGELSHCMVEKECTKLVLSKLECPAIVPRSIDKFDVKTLSRYERLFVARGSNDLYDGLPCQYLTFDLKPNGKV